MCWLLSLYAVMGCTIFNLLVFLYNFNLNSVTAPTAKPRLPLFRIIVNNGFESLEGMSYVAFFCKDIALSSTVQNSSS